jgi:hypothetical protein
VPFRALSCRLLLGLPEGASLLLEGHLVELMQRLMAALAAAAGEAAGLTKGFGRCWDSINMHGVVNL